MSARNTAVLIGDLGKYHDERRAASGSALKPCMLAQTNGTDEVTQHASAGSFWEGLFVKEDDMQGRVLGTTYAVGDPVMLHRAQPGDLLQLILVAGVSVTPNDYLTSNGDGKVKKATSTDERSFKCGEILDLTALPDGYVKAYVRN